MSVSKNGIQLFKRVRNIGISEKLDSCKQLKALDMSYLYWGRGCYLILYSWCFVDGQLRNVAELESVGYIPNTYSQRKCMHYTRCKLSSIGRTKTVWYFNFANYISSLLNMMLVWFQLQWRHNGCDWISNHQPHDCLLSVYSVAHQRKHQSSASLAFVRGIHRWPVNSPHKWSVTRKMFPFDDVHHAQYNSYATIQRGESSLSW